MKARWWIFSDRARAGRPWWSLGAALACWTAQLVTLFALSRASRRDGPSRQTRWLKHCDSTKKNGNDALRLEGSLIAQLAAKKGLDAHSQSVLRRIDQDSV